MFRVSVVVAALLAVGAISSASGPARGARVHLIAFHADSGGPGDVYVVGPSGVGTRRLTRSISHLPTAVWSPDGSRLAFLARPRGAVDVYVIRANGTGLRQLTRGEGDHWGGVGWAPDGRRLSFACCGERNVSLYVIGADGKGRRLLAANAGQAAWSPDGSRLAILGFSDGDPEIYLVSADGSTKTRLTRSRGEDVDPSWSADGRRIVFVSSRSGRSQIYVMNADGSGRRRLVSDRWADEDPAWSPDGTRIAFTSYRNKDPHTLGIGNAEIVVASADGTNVRNLTASRYWEGQPAWSPDGRQIAYATRRDFGRNGGLRLAIMNADGSGRRLLPAVPDPRIPSGKANSCCPAWQP